MDLLTLVKMILGRWRVVVPILVVTFGLAFAIQSSSPPLYQASGYLNLESPEFAAADETAPVIDPIAIAEGIELEGDTEGRNYTVSLLGGSSYSVAAAAPSASQAEDDAQSVISALGQRIEQLQEQGGVALEERVELQLVDPRIVAEGQPDGTYVATANVLLNDPSLLSGNPYLGNSSTGRLLQVWFEGDAAQAEFAQQTNGTVGVSVGQQSRDTAPLLQVVTIGANPEEVIEGFYVAQEILAGDLQRRQDRADVLPSDQIRLVVLNAPLGVTDESPPVERTAVAVIALGGLAALGAALAVEVLGRRSRTAKGARPNPIIDLLGPVARPTNDGDEAVRDRGGPVVADHPESPPTMPPSVAPMPREQPAPRDPSVNGHGTAPEPLAETEPTNHVLEDKLRAALARRPVPPPQIPPPPQPTEQRPEASAPSSLRARGYLSPVPDDLDHTGSRAPGKADQAGT